MFRFCSGFVAANLVSRGWLRRIEEPAFGTEVESGQEFAACGWQIWKEDSWFPILSAEASVNRVFAEAFLLPGELPGGFVPGSPRAATICRFQREKPCAGMD